MDVRGVVVGQSYTGFGGKAHPEFNQRKVSGGSISPIQTIYFMGS
jgi:hypothetical protein